MSIQALRYQHLLGTAWVIDESAGPPWRVDIFNSDHQEFEPLSAFPYIAVWGVDGSLLVNVDGDLVLTV